MDEKKLCELLRDYAMAKGIDVTVERIKFNARYLLKKFSFFQIQKAMNELFITNPYFPDASDVAKKIYESEGNENNKTLAVDAVARIIQSVREFGRYDHERAEKFIGDLGWMVVERQGGWSSFCDFCDTRTLGTLRAQMICIAESIIERAKSGTLYVPPKIPSLDENKNPKGHLVKINFGERARS